MAIEKLDTESTIERVKNYLLDLQLSLSSFLTQADPDLMVREDKWEYTEKGGGITRVLTQGQFFEKAGINFSHIQGASLPPAATLKRPQLNHLPFHALGVSTVIHPLNPYIPTTHLNVRFFMTPEIWWFGGGFDLTPYYGFTEDCIHWHLAAKNACTPFGEDVYPRFKKLCDEYFYLKHRHEPRGIGGIFFDDLNEWGFEQSFSFMRSVGNHFLMGYAPIVTGRKNHPYGERERRFQLFRRGRYVEFNLLYDRGTLFGLQSQGRTESILISLPPMVSWDYNYPVEVGSEEERLYKEFLIVKNWDVVA